MAPRLRPADVRRRAPERSGTLLAVCVVAACTVNHEGLGRGRGGDAGGDRPQDLSTADGADMGRPDSLTPPERVSGPPMPPEIAGCADGTREGFLDVETWPGIAGCGGGWSVAGLVPAAEIVPTCLRGGGNSGSNPTGDGCSAADLCADGWRICRRTQDIATRSPTGCTGAAATPEKQFFAAALGATASGVCLPDLPGLNNIYGCGNVGDEPDASCQPLNASLTFAACYDTETWSCGTAEDWLREATVVVKRGPDLGGVLCCRE